MANVLHDSEIAAFQRDGFVYARNLFDPKEVALLREAMEKDPKIQEHMLDRADGEGGAT